MLARPDTVSRGAVCGFASAGAPATISAQRGSARRCLVCSDRSDSSISGDRPGAVAGVTSPANGCPSRCVASVPARAARSSRRACIPGGISLSSPSAAISRFFLLIYAAIGA